MPKKNAPKPAAGYSWNASIIVEGGPIVLMDLRDYAHWTGAVHPLDTKPTRLHFWGQFTAKLPKKFRPNGSSGHQYLEASSHAEARKLVDELGAFIKKKWPRSKTQRAEHKASGSISGEWVLPNDESMWLELVNPSDYELAWQGLDASGVAIHTWRDGRRAVVWDLEGSGVASLGVNKTKSELVIYRQWIDEDEHEALVRQAALEGKKEKKRGSIELGGTHVVVAWAAPPRSAAKRASTEASLKKIAEKKTPEFDAGDSDSVGAVLKLKKGKYEVFVGHAKGKGWSCRWCHLRLMC